MLKDSDVRSLTVLVASDDEANGAAFGVMKNLYDRGLVNIVRDRPEDGHHPSYHIVMAERLAIAAMLKNDAECPGFAVYTHSPYVLDRLVTLVTASALRGDARARVVRQLALQDERALLTPDRLAVYRVAADGMLVSIYHEHGPAVDPSVFSDVGDAETNLYSDVLEALQQQAEERAMASRGEASSCS